MRCKHLLLYTLLLCVMSLALSGSSLANDEVPCNGCGNGIIEAMAVNINHATPMYENAKMILEEMDPSEWSDQEVFEYLQASIRLIYYAMVWQLVSDGNQHLLNPEDLMTRGYLLEWPKNPYNDWAPIQIRDTQDGFFPGDVIREICPSHEATRGVKLSFQLYILGSDEEWFLEPVEAIQMNSSWATIPVGTAYAIGYHAENDLEIEERKAKLVEFLKHLIEQDDETESEEGE